MATREQMIAAFGSEQAYLEHMASIGRRGGKSKVQKGVAKRGGWRVVVEDAVRVAKLEYSKELLAVYRARSRSGGPMFDFEGVLRSQIEHLEAEVAGAAPETNDS